MVSSLLLAKKLESPPKLNSAPKSMLSGKLVEKSCRSRKMGERKEDMMAKRQRGRLSGGSVNGGISDDSGGGGRPLSDSCEVGQR